MNRTLFPLLLLASTCIAQAPQDFEFRIWTNANGRRTETPLKFVERSESDVKLERQDNGKAVTLSIASLSIDDQTYLSNLAEGANDPVGSSSQGNWAQFRGPGARGIAVESVPTEWSDSKNIVWKTKIPGHGGSSPVVFNGRVYVTFYDGYGLSQDSPGDKSNLMFHLMCVNMTDGNVVWDQAIPPTGKVKDYGGFIALHGYATSTPVVDETGIYVFYGTTGLHAYDHDGTLR